MKYYNVSKYNRNNPEYLDEWTSIWGALDDECVDKKKWSDYLKTERQYLNFAVSFLVKNDINEFEISGLEINLDDETEADFHKIRYGLLDPEWFVISKAQNRSILSELDKISMVQLALRGIVWFKFAHINSGITLSFDNDYYFLIGIKDCSYMPVPSDFDLYSREMNNPWE